jgi:hypothetical protein
MTRITVDSMFAAAMQLKNSPKNLSVRGAEYD